MHKYNIIGIGNAIVDVISKCSETVISDLALKKGAMCLIDEAAADSLYAKMGPSTECSGGSVANTLAGIAGLGAKCAFIGKVRNDQLGEIFRHDMRTIGVAFDTPAATSGPATARCLIFVTPDAQRTMNTYIGACAQVSEDDIDASLLQNSDLLYVEGYLWDQPAAKAAIRKAFSAAHQYKKKVAFTLSDTFCVERHREEFLELLGDSIDILFANEDELMALFETVDFNEALALLQGRCEIAAVTRSEKGCVIVTAQEMISVPAPPVTRVLDTTGAGDLFASGFLYGLSQGWPLKQAASLGNRCAGTIIQQMGARSLTPLKPLADAVSSAA